jgi:4-hydroxybenzoate polyprenyltransferase
VQFDREHRLYSVPARFGIPAALTIARVCHVLTIAAFALLGVTMGLGWLYWLGVLVVAGLLVYEHSLVSPSDLSRLDVAFFNVNGYIAVILFLAVVAGRLA